MTQFHRSKVIDLRSESFSPLLCSVGIPKMILGREVGEFRGDSFPYPVPEGRSFRSLSSAEIADQGYTKFLESVETTINEAALVDPVIGGAKITTWNDAVIRFDDGRVLINTYLAVNGLPAFFIHDRNSPQESAFEIFHHGLVGTQYSFIPEGEGFRCSAKLLFKRESLRESLIHAERCGSPAPTGNNGTPKMKGPFGLDAPYINFGLPPDTQRAIALSFCRSCILDSEAESFTEQSSGPYKLSLSCALRIVRPRSMEYVARHWSRLSVPQDFDSLDVVAAVQSEIRPADESFSEPKKQQWLGRYLFISSVDHAGEVRMSVRSLGQLL